jgi:hypothetical protein
VLCYLETTFCTLHSGTIFRKIAVCGFLISLSPLWLGTGLVLTFPTRGLPAQLASEQHQQLSPVTKLPIAFNNCTTQQTASLQLFKPATYSLIGQSNGPAVF